jgi:hypothetical protein
MLHLLQSQFTAPTRDAILSQMNIVLNLTSRAVTSKNNFNEYPPICVMLSKSSIPTQFSE